ncbi:gamma-glutamyl-gamma-aminobutyrate hydrolase family protein [Enterococcus quebecensis]|uniref:gamma-glutamyl-gamma-aminobutyrate hydrolase family protein n=1 Tax=Enterococcus quebecensis TaxID=903983 RepID=UPI000A4BF4F4|nr:gamma-glutamyl-gamma-aminobutyrate hydrolase family protein [Enterococcus quebecensis]
MKRIKKKKIGITSNYFTNETDLFRSENHFYVMDGYINAIRNCGAIPFIIPYGTPQSIDDYIHSFDGFVLTGGQDITPELYGQDEGPLTRTTHIERDVFEIELIQQAIRNHKSILGICRGSQLINVALGGTLYQDLSLSSAFIAHEQSKNTNNELPTHKIKIFQNSILYQHLGGGCEVNSIHHQGIDQLSNELNPSAISEDGIIEAFESKNKKNKIFGVQWHPEMMARNNPNMNKIFELVL